MTESRIEVQEKSSAADVPAARAEAVEGFKDFAQVKTEMTSPSTTPWLPNLEIVDGERSAADRVSGSPDGTDKPGDTTQTDKHRESLREIAERRIADPEAREQFNRDMEKFEQRARELGLPSSEITKSFGHVGRLLDGGSEHVTPENRALAARGLAHHLANPSSNDQGPNNTCQVAVLAERLATRSPSVTADMVATAALTGEWKSPNGDGSHRGISLDKSAFTPSIMEAVFPPVRDLDRTFASRLMHHALLNDIMQRKDGYNFGYGQEDLLKDNETGERTGLKTWPTGEFFVKPDGGFQRFVPAISDGDMRRTMERHTGDPGMVHGRHPTRPESIDELKEALSAGATRHGYPLTVEVDPSHKSFGNIPSTVGVSHFVNITGYNAETGNYRVSNSLGSRFDREVTLKELFDARVHKPVIIKPPTNPTTYWDATERRSIVKEPVK